MPDLSPDVERELEAVDDALAGRRVAPDMTELADLALLLRDDRPAPTESFGRYLDNRVERGFPGRDPRPRTSRRRWTIWQAWMGPGLAAGLAVVIAGLVIALPSGQDESESGGGAQPASRSSDDSAGGGNASSTESAGSGAAADSSGGAEQSLREAAPGGDDEAASSGAEPQSVAPAPAPGSPGSDGRSKRKIERSASITLATRPRDIDTVSARIQDVTRQQGGFVVSSSVRSSRRDGGGEFTLRIPTRNLDAAMAALSRLAAVRDRADRSQDITAESVSARSRLKDARTERKALLEQLADADTVQETASIRARLRVVSGEIARARTEVRRVNNRAAFSTVTVQLVADRSAVAPGTEEDDGSWSPGDAARDALRVLEVVVGVALIALAIGIPLALVALLGWLGARVTRRRRREHVLDAI
jgi:Domain of unknown function (DUF4349)